MPAAVTLRRISGGAGGRDAAGDGVAAISGGMGARGGTLDFAGG